MKLFLMLTLLGLPAVAEGFEPVKLPDGTLFETWEQPCVYSQTYHVAQKHRKASDDNPGTQDLPWKTLSKAAATLQPGERVIVHEGVYREWVSPERGGDGPDKMIAYETAAGDDVIVKGSDIWQPDWKKEQGETVTWKATLDPEMFDGPNVFALENFPEQDDPDIWKRFPTNRLYRGQLFADGLPLVQVPTFEQLAEKPGRFWVEDDNLTVHVRLHKDAKPRRRKIEVTTREQVFAPAKHYLNYIRVSGFRMFHAANGVPIPIPQHGLLSASAGHHWIIEDCEIGYANTLGMDVGSQWYTFCDAEMYGHQIVRRNYIHNCGVCGACAWFINHDNPTNLNDGLLVEDNLFADNSWMPITLHCESGSLKMHYVQNSLFRRNVFLRTGHSASLWLDGYIHNTRITQNFFYDAQHPRGLGSVFIEISEGPTLVDNNIVVQSGDNGFHQHDAERIAVLQNLFAHGNGYGMHLVKGAPERVDPPYENHHRLFGNVVAGFKRWIMRANNTTHSGSNVFAPKGAKLDRTFCTHHDGEANEIGFEAWRALGQGENSVVADVEVEFDLKHMTLDIDADPFPEYQTFPELIPEMAPANELLTEDYFGRARPTGRFDVGPILEPVLDGKPLFIDSRTESARKRFRIPTEPKIDLIDAYASVCMPPQPFFEDYEGQAVGDPPRNADRYGCENGASIAVTDETAATGTHGLKFTDVGKPNHPCQPEMCYHPNLFHGIAVSRFDVRLEAGAIFWHVLRAGGHDGPLLIFTETAEILVDDKPLTKFPRGQWLHIEIECPLGDQANGKFSLRVLMPDGEPKRFDNLPCSFKEFRSIESSFYLSFTDGKSVFYLDNVGVETKD